MPPLGWYFYFKRLRRYEFEPARSLVRQGGGADESMPVRAGGSNNDEAAEQSDVSPVIPTIKQNITLGVIFCLLCFLQKIPSLFGGGMQRCRQIPFQANRRGQIVRVAAT